ncbi:NAD-dependent malic enzyme [Halomonas elongata]|nr:NAD-dependent malic enzyme [Halomonas elongata]
MAASRALAAEAPVAKTGEGAVLPALSKIRELSKAIAFEVALEAQREDVALKSDEQEIRAAIERHFWYPEYRDYRRRSF